MAGTHRDQKGSLDDGPDRQRAMPRNEACQRVDQAPGEGRLPWGRRGWLEACVGATSAALLSCSRQAGAAPAASAPEGEPKTLSESEEAPATGSSGATRKKVEPRPLPFDPKKLRGLSEKLPVSHHDNNYVGAVKKLNDVESRIEKLSDQAPLYVVSALHHKRMVFENSVALHELYFENLGGDGQPSGKLAEALAKQFGAISTWEARFERAGRSLAGGSGWGHLSYHLRRQVPFIDVASDHSRTTAESVILLALDMYEHSYHMDFGTAAARYIKAFMANVDWAVVERRYQRALTMAS